MLVSGSLPMSSALTASTTEVASLLVAIDVSIECRMPVTTTSWMGSSLAFAPRQLRRPRNSPLRYRCSKCHGGMHNLFGSSSLAPQRQIDGDSQPSNHSPRITGKGNLPTLLCETYSCRMGVSIS